MNPALALSLVKNWYSRSHDANDVFQSEAALLILLLLEHRCRFVCCDSLGMANAKEVM